MKTCQKINGEALSSTLIEDLASHANKNKGKLNESIIN
jgi:hypothetical protein